jgi:8-oxo-dGTP pyrophosphatase MutT (NUDIX family)
MKKIADIILENDKGAFLLALLDNKPGIPLPNHWDLIGGHVEEGEHLQHFTRDEIPDIKFANIIRSIVTEYINESG